MLAGFAGAEDGVGEISVIRSIGEILGFQAQAGTGLIADAIAPGPLLVASWWAVSAV